MPKFRREARVAFAGIELNPIEGLRVAFEADKLDGQRVNHALISIYNLAPSARALLARPYPLNAKLVEPVVTVILEAGYEGEVVRVMSGDLVSAVNRKDGPDWVTTLNVYSGFNAATRAEVPISFGGATPAKTVADRILNALGLDVRYTPEALQVIGRERVTDYSEIGLAYRLADDFLQRYGLAFTIEEQDQGLVYVPERPRDPDAGQTQGNTFSPQTGLIGAPEVTNFGVVITVLLRPDLKLLQRIFVESDTIAASIGGSDLASDYHILSMRHIGDTRGDEWYTEIEAFYSNLQDATY